MHKNRQAEAAGKRGSDCAPDVAADLDVCFAPWRARSRPVAPGVVDPVAPEARRRACRTITQADESARRERPSHRTRIRERRDFP